MSVGQVDNTLSGTWARETQLSATLNGTINGSTVSFIIQGVDTEGYRGAVTTTYTGSINGNTINGTFDGAGSWDHEDTDRSGTFAWSGTFTVTIEEE